MEGLAITIVTKASPWRNVSVYIGMCLSFRIIGKLHQSLQLIDKVGGVTPEEG